MQKNTIYYYYDPDFGEFLGFNQEIWKVNIEKMSCDHWKGSFPASIKCTIISTPEQWMEIIVCDRDASLVQAINDVFNDKTPLINRLNYRNITETLEKIDNKKKGKKK